MKAKRLVVCVALLVGSAAAAQNYTIQSQSATYAPIVGGTSLVGFGSNQFPSDADEEQIVVPLGFTFPFYGQTFTQVTLNSNGFLTFDPAGCQGSPGSSLCFDGGKIPSTSRSSDFPHNIIAPWWDDFAFIPGTTDVVYTSTGSQFDVEYKNVGPFFGGNYQLTFRVTLTSSGLIRIAYGSNGTGATGGSATVGFENGNGTQGASLPLPPSSAACSSTSAGCAMANWPTNTLFTIGQPVQPDLVVDSVNLNSVSKTSSNLTVSVTPTFRNFGQNNATGFLWKAWLSTDRTLQTATDIPVFTSSTPLNCAGGATVQDTGMATIPLPAPGNYYVLVQADVTSTVTEADETNNVGSTQNYFVSGLDMVATGIGGPANSGPGNMMTVEVKYFNQGTDPAGLVQYEVRLSTDTVFQSSDFLLYSGTKTISGGQTVDDMVTFPVPDNTPGGDSYYILHILPVANETSTTNNDIASSSTVNIKNADLVAVAPDFVDVSTGVSTRRGLFGEQGRLTVTAQNVGGADARNFKVAVILSPDVNLSLLSDTIITEQPVMNVTAGTSQVVDLTFTIPLNDKNGHPFATGTYYMFALLDSGGTVTELNEQNNFLSVKDPVLLSAPAPDLTVVRIDAPSSAGVGEIAPVYRVLKNIGNVASPAVKYRYYLSANTTITVDDTPVPIVTNGTPADFGTVTLNVGQVDAATELVQLPPTLTPGTWYLGALMDVDDSVAELDETNNGLASTAVQVASSSLRVATPAVADGVMGRMYSFGLAVSGDVPGMASTWTLDESQGPLPPGLALATNGVIAGTPTMTGVWGFTVIVANAGRQAIGRLAMRVLPTTTQVEITTPGLPSIVNSPTIKYEVDLGASGGAQPYSWSISSGALPNGLTLNATAGIISGNPKAGTQEGMSMLTLQVKDALGTTAQHTFTLRVVAAGSIVFKNLAIPDALVKQDYTTDIPVENADGSQLAKPLVFQIVGGSLPPGMAAHTEQDQVYLVTGTPLVAGTYPFTLMVTDARGRSDEGDFIMRVYPARLKVAASGMPDQLRPGDPVDFSFIVSGNLEAKFAVYSGALPPGTTMDEAGHVSGTVDSDNSEGSYNFVVEADDKTGASGLGAFSIQISRNVKMGGCSAAPSGMGLWLLAAFLPLLGMRRRVRGLGVALAVLLVPLAARAQDYSVIGPTPITYSALPNPTNVGAGGSVTIPFSFKFYGQPISTVAMSTYGYLAVAGADPLESFNQGIPGMDSFYPTSIIAPWWDDISSSPGGALRYQVFGTAPNRYIAFEWSNVYATSSSQRMSFQAILYEGTNQIRFAYGGAAPSSGSASVGIQKQLGTGLAALSCTTATSGSCGPTNYPGSPSPSAIDFFLPADLTIASVSMDQIGYAGVNFHASALVNNLGGRAAAGTVVRFYLSTDATLEDADIVLGDSSPQTVPANGQLLMTALGRVPAATMPGNYFVLSKVDPANVTAESDETNNVGPPTGIQVGPPTADLVVQGVTAPTMATPGATLAAGRTIQNVGNADAAAFKYTWFLSNNSVVSISDTVLGMPGSVSSLTVAMPTNTATDMVTLPASLIAGQYWIGACVNYDPNVTPNFGIPEISQVNNCNQATMPIVVSSGALAIVTTTLPAVTQYAPFGLRLIATGATGSYQWAVDSGSTLPPGLHLTAQGDLQGSPAVAGAFTFVVQVSSGGMTKTQSLMLSVASGTIPLTVVDQVPPAAEFGRAYQSALVAVGGKPPYLWALKPDAKLPQGLAISTDGLIEGRALETGDFSFGVTVTDSAQQTAQKDLRMRVVNPSTMHIATGKLKAAYLKQDYTQELETVGGKPPYTWTLARFQQLPLNATETPGSVVMGDFPADFGIAIDDGNADYLKGVPKLAGLFALELHVADAAGSEDATTLLLDVTYTDPIAITTTSLPDAFIGHDYEAKLSHNRGKESTGVQFSVPCIEQATAADMFACAPMDPTQNLPAGLQLGPDGSITGSPVDAPGAADKTYSFLVKVVDDAGRQDVRSLSIRLRPPIGTTGGCSVTDFGPIALLALVALRRKRARP